MIEALDDLAFVYLPKILLAIFCGSLIGLERELKDKPAGIKTYMLICAGATLFTMVSIAFTDLFGETNEPSRVAAQIITGVGFLGAGTIMFSKGRYIKGLTSAAAIWWSAAVGMAIGIGMYLFSVVVTLILILALIALGKLEARLGLKGKRHFTITLTVSNPEDMQKVMTLMTRSRGSCNLSNMVRKENISTMTISCNLTNKEMNQLLAAIQRLGGDISYKIES